MSDTAGTATGKVQTALIAIRFEFLCTTPAKKGAACISHRSLLSIFGYRRAAGSYPPLKFDDFDHHPACQNWSENMFMKIDDGRANAT
jgi:hypothetical protein